MIASLRRVNSLYFSLFAQSLECSLISISVRTRQEGSLSCGSMKRIMAGNGCIHNAKDMI